MNNFLLFRFWIKTYLIFVFDCKYVYKLGVTVNYVLYGVG
jgi:hypothetical protein